MVFQKGNTYIIQILDIGSLAFMDIIMNKGEQ